MKKVLMIVHEMNRGGIENFIMNLYRVIDRDVIQFDFVAHTYKKCDFDNEIEELGGTVFHCPDYRIVNHISYCKWWKDFFASHPEYKIVHSHLDSSANIHLRIAKKFGCVTIAHSHNTQEGIGIRALVKKFLKFGFNSCCDYKFGCSKAANKWLYGKQSGNSLIIRNGIISSRYAFDLEKRKYYEDKFGIDGKSVIGSVARFSNQKNHEFIVDVFYEYNKLNPNSVLMLVGDGELKQSIIQKVNTLCLNENVIFTGVRSDVSELLNVFDLFLMPSFHEGLPVSIIEAQASGLKCLLSDVITKETDITGNLEFLSLKKSAKEWAEEISKMLSYDRTDTSEKIKKAGYDIMTTAQQLTDFYLGL